MNLVKWNYGDIPRPLRVKIQTSDSFNGTYTDLITINHPVTHYDDLTTPESYYYRLLVYYGLELGPIDLDFSNNDTLNIGKFPLVVDSERIMMDSVLLIKDLDYTIDYNTGDITRIATGALNPNILIKATAIYEVESEPTIPKKIQTMPMCTVYGYVWNINGVPLGQEKIIFKIVRPPQFFGELMTEFQPIIITTENDGFFEVELPQKAVIKVSNIKMGLDDEMVIPEVDTKRFKDLLEESR